MNAVKSSDWEARGVGGWQQCLPADSVKFVGRFTGPDADFGILIVKQMPDDTLAPRESCSTPDGVTSYSIKELAPVCGFQWRQEDVDGLSAQLLYLQWRETGDDPLIARVQQYNREDLQAMLAVDRYVEGLPIQA